jgi:diphosphomevalonate decarboxylase
MTTITPIEGKEDQIILNGKVLEPDSVFVTRTSAYLNLFRPEQDWHLKMDVVSDVPIAAGLASSACGFASLVTAMNELFDWKLSQRDLSILARLGSGSASRSLWKGFVEWHAGTQPDGMDSYAEPLDINWPELCVGILSIDENQKPLSSSEAMQRTVDSSVLFACWPKKAAQDMAMIKQALKIKNFSLLGGTAEANALNMHAVMLSCWPPICYFLPETIKAMHQVWALRKEGLELYFTQDAGPNLKLLFQGKDKATVQRHFPEVEVIKVFG